MASLELAAGTACSADVVDGASITCYEQPALFLCDIDLTE